MAEALAIVSGGLSIASFALQVSDKIFQIKKFLDTVKSASPEIQSCLEEIQLLNEILLDWETQNPAPPGDAISRRCAQQCRRTTELVSELLNEFQAKIGKRKSRGSIEFALKKSELERILGQLERIKSTLSIAHLVSQRRLQAQWAERHDNAIQAAIDRATSNTHPQKASSSSPPSLTLLGSQHNTSRRPAFRVALPTWLSGKVWEIYTAQSQIEWAFRMRTYNIISKDSLIFDFAETGDIDGLKYLLDHNQGSVFDCDVKGYNALIIAAANGHVAACQYLLNAGADPCAATDYGLTPLHCAFFYTYKENYRNTTVSEQMDSDLVNFALRLIPKTQDMILESPKIFLGAFYGPVLQSILATIQPPFYQWPLPERINLFRFTRGFCVLGLRKSEDIPLAFTSDERENLSLYREQILPLIFECCAETIFFFPDELEGYDLLLTSVLRNYSNQSRTGASCSLQSLVMLCAQLWITNVNHHPYQRLQRGLVYGRSFYYEDTLCFEKIFDKKYTPMQILARAIEGAGVDLLEFGNEEVSLLAKGLVDQDMLCPVYDDKDDVFRDTTIRLIGISYGPKPEDWHCWLSDFTDEYAGGFWEMVENAEPQLRVPGAWVV